MLTVGSVAVWVFGLLFVAHRCSGSDISCTDSSKSVIHNSTFDKLSLWKGLTVSAEGQGLYGINEALEKIWQNQNPPECSKAKYLIATGWYHDFASEIHYLDVMLGIALDTGRVLLNEGGWTWRYRNEHCEKQNKKNLECYFEPFSKCTLRDAMAIMTAEYVHKNQHNTHAHDSHNTERPEPNHHHAPDKSHLAANPVVEWTDAEDKKLVDAVQDHGKKGHWSIISALLDQKTDVQCYERWHKHIEPMWRRRRGNPSYIQKLLDDNDLSIVDYTTQHKVVALNRVMDAAVGDTSGKLMLNIKHKDTIKDNVLMFDSELIVNDEKIRHFVPPILKNIVECAKLQKGHEYLWWRAVASTFILRPNKATLALIEKHSDATLKETGGQCISVHMPHKEEEAKVATISHSASQSTIFDGQVTVHPTHTNSTTSLHSHAVAQTKPQFVPLIAYSGAIMNAFQNKTTPNSSSGNKNDKNKNVVYFVTDDSSLLNDAMLWSSNKKLGLTFHVSDLTKQTLAYTAASSGSNKDHKQDKHHSSHNYIAQADLEKSLPPHKTFEYLSYLLQISEALQCKTLICSYASHFCRILDELKSTVGGGGGGHSDSMHNIDVSSDTCEKVPCVRPYALGNIPAGNKVYDPKELLW